MVEHVTDDSKMITAADSRLYSTRSCRLRCAQASSLDARRDVLPRPCYPRTGASLHLKVPVPPPPPLLVPSCTGSTTLALGKRPHRPRYLVCPTLSLLGCLHWRLERHPWSDGRHPPSARRPSFPRYGSSTQSQGTPPVRATSSVGTPLLSGNRLVSVS